MTRIVAAARSAIPGEGVLGVLGFGVSRPADMPDTLPWARIDLEVLDGPDTELILAEGPCRPVAAGRFAGAADGASLFCWARFAQSGDLAETTERAFAEMVGFVRESGFPHLLRVSSYVPRITDDEAGMERYRSFVLGRHNAYWAAGLRPGAFPAACALGSEDEDIVVVVLASRAPGAVIENPRQISAWAYPTRYGPRPPSFARAMLDDGGTLLVSGTASIVGHESLHPGDVVAQTRELDANLRIIAAEASLEEHRRQLRVYLRRAADLDAVRDVLGVATYLRATVCRPELLVEAEAVILPG